MARDSGWKIKRIQRMKGVSLYITDPDRPGYFAGLFGSTEERAWELLAERWNEDKDDFWRKEPE